MAALTAFEDRQAHFMIDMLLAEFTLDTVFDEVMLPAMREIGESWERGEVTVAQEHFASNLIRERVEELQRHRSGAQPLERERHRVACFGSERVIIR